MTDTEMRRSWLVQRLQKPRNFGQLVDNPFSFGGGLRNGGLSAEAMNVLRPIFSFDYMGAAEFEFGAVPEALGVLAKAADENQRKTKLVAFSFDIDLANVPAHWSAPKNAPKPEGTGAIYVLCHKAHAAEVETRIRGWASGKEGLKERTALTDALRPTEDYHRDTCGWLELDNGFMFFTDADMWAATCSVFALEAEVSA